jgi:hypothetical protein
MGCQHFRQSGLASSLDVVMLGSSSAPFRNVDSRKSAGDERTAAHMTPVNAIGGARCKTRLMIAQLPPDRMPPPRPEGIPRFQRLFREAAGLNFDKADLKRYEDFIDHRIYLLLLRAEANAKAGGDVLIEPWNLPITAGLQECIEQFRKMDETIELEPILDRLANRPPLQFSYSDQTEAMLPDLAGGLGVAVARAMKIIEPDLKNPQTRQWELATRIFELLL